MSTRFVGSSYGPESNRLLHYVEYLHLKEVEKDIPANLPYLPELIEGCEKRECVLLCLACALFTCFSVF
jgi:hypothetical protein